MIRALPIWPDAPGKFKGNEKGPSGKKDQETFEKKTVISASISVSICLIWVAAVFFHLREIKTYDGLRPVGTVNGEPFFQEDLDIYALELRAAVAADYGRRYSLSSMESKFWNTKYGDAAPGETLYRMALDRVVRNMALIQESP